jgi:hypothetical protein
MPKTESKKVKDMLKPLDDLIKDVQKHTNDGVDCLKHTRRDIAKTINDHLDDTEKRVDFFNKWHTKSPYGISKEYPKICNAFMRQESEYHVPYITWLFAFCFSNRKKTFDEILRERGK